MTKRDLRRALEHDLEQIEDNARLFREGRNSAYQTVAIQLRNLLLGGRRGLLRRAVSESSFHAFPTSISRMPPTQAGQVRIGFDTRGGFLRVGGSGAGAQLHLMFGDELLGLEAWLDQWILLPEIKIRDLIRATTDDEVAHTEDETSDVLQAANSISLFGRPEGRRFHAMAIVSLGEYVAAHIRHLINETEGSD